MCIMCSGCTVESKVTQRLELCLCSVRLPDVSCIASIYSNEAFRYALKFYVGMEIREGELSCYLVKKNQDQHFNFSKLFSSPGTSPLFGKSFEIIDDCWMIVQERDVE